jgi:phosphotransferase system  glucose/maltose/N-acetylglucosamine-specific IIC component
LKDRWIDIRMKNTINIITITIIITIIIIITITIALPSLLMILNPMFIKINSKYSGVSSIDGNILAILVEEFLDR